MVFWIKGSFQIKQNSKLKPASFPVYGLFLAKSLILFIMRTDLQCKVICICSTGLAMTLASTCTITMAVNSITLDGKDGTPVKKIGGTVSEHRTECFFRKIFLKRIMGLFTRCTAMHGIWPWRDSTTQQHQHISECKKNKLWCCWCVTA